MSSLVGPTNDLDNTPFRSLRPRSRISLSGGGVATTKMQGPVVCSVAPNLPARPPSSSDNDSIRKNHWDMDYEGLCLSFFGICSMILTSTWCLFWRGYEGGGNVKLTFNFNTVSCSEERVTLVFCDAAEPHNGSKELNDLVIEGHSKNVFVMQSGASWATPDCP